MIIFATLASVAFMLLSKQEILQSIPSLPSRPSLEQLARIMATDQSQVKLAERIIEDSFQGAFTRQNVQKWISETNLDYLQTIEEKEVVEELIKVLGYENESDQFLKAIRSDPKLYQMTA